MNLEKILELQKMLSSVNDGELDVTKYGSLITEVWTTLDGSSDTKLYASKLYRMENLRKLKGKIYFDIERHGGTVNGSTRGELFTWEIDPNNATARVVSKTHRQLYKMDKRLNVAPLANEIACCIMKKQLHDYLLWDADKSKCTLLISLIIPETNTQTTIDRRKRLRKAINEHLKLVGLEITNRNIVSFVTNNRFENEYKYSAS